MTRPENGWHAPHAAGRMRAAATAFVAALRPEQRSLALAPLDVADHRAWTYLPGSRPGLPLSEMTPPQRELAMALLDTGLSEAGRRDARAIMALESTLRAIEEAAGESAAGYRGWDLRDPNYYWFRVLGDPAGPAPWA